MLVERLSMETHWGYAGKHCNPNGCTKTQYIRAPRDTVDCPLESRYYSAT